MNAKRVVVLSGAPGQIIAEHRIDAPRPRRRGEAAEAEIVRAVRLGPGADTVADGQVYMLLKKEEATDDQISRSASAASATPAEATAQGREDGPGGGT